MKRKIPLVLLLIGLAGAAGVFLRPKPAPPPVRLHPTAHQFAQAQQRLETLSRDVSLPQPPPLQTTRPGAAGPKVTPQARTLHLSENDLNVYLAGSPSVRKLLSARGVQAVQIVLLEPANVTIYATASVNGHPQNTQIDGALSPDPKTGLRFTASHAQVGRLPLPAAFVTAQANVLAVRLLLQLHARLPMRVQNVSVQGKDLVIAGLPTAAASPQSASPARR